MLITVIVESMYMGSASGFTQVVVDDSEPVQTIVKKFCDIKGAPVDPLYAIVNDANISFDSHKAISDYRVQDNDHLRLGRRRETSHMFRFVSWYRLSILGTLVGLVGLIGLCVAFALVRQTPLKYGVIFDAGSTHTDALVYQWPGEKHRGTGHLSQLKNCSIEKKGIADIPVKNVSHYLGDCIRQAKDSIPSNSLHETEVFFGATAGMRILQEANETVVDNILEEVRKTLADSGFIYEDWNVGVISGDREGLSGWISVNFLNKSLGGANMSESEIQDQTIGSLDLGGASMQVSVEVDNTSLSEESQALVQPVQLYERTYSVYTQSFLCYGLVQATRRYRALLIMNHNNNSSAQVNISSPCEPKGYSYQKKVSSIFGGPCVPGGSGDLDRSTVFTFYGTNDFSSCQEKVHQLVKPDFCELVQSSHCLSNSTFPPELSKTRFMAYSAFGHVINDLNMSHVGSKQDFINKTNGMCSISYEHLVFLQSSFKIPLSLHVLEGLCFGGHYIQALLTDVFNFTTSEDWTRLDFRTEVSGVGVSWSLGYMMNETVYMGKPDTVPEMDTVTFVILLLVCSLLVVFGILFFIQALKLDQPTTYERHSIPRLQPSEIL